MQDLAKDQHLHGKSNFNEWQGIKEFMEVDIVGKINDRVFIYNPNANDFNRISTKLITKILQQASFAPIRNNNTEVNRNNDIDINTQLIFLVILLIISG